MKWSCCAGKSIKQQSHDQKKRSWYKLYKSFWIWKVEPMQKCLKLTVFLVDSRGCLWLQVWLCRSLWENDPTSHLICISKQCPDECLVSVTSDKVCLRAWLPCDWQVTTLGTLPGVQSQIQLGYPPQLYPLVRIWSPKTKMPTAKTPNSKLQNKSTYQ